ncbi:hypothetical protein GCM10023333_41940 [Ferrimonas pelagia]|uniref:Uncharacterized protein n=1 Tax=Ferrimonas pelagia TaxID=1177826 RepID=A0ABP9FHG1_9GAMM
MRFYYGSDNSVGKAEVRHKEYENATGLSGYAVVDKHSRERGELAMDHG